MLAAAGAVTTLGILNWDYGSESPHLHSEGWFGYNTPHGGADKAGHLFTSYVLANALPDLYQSWGFEPDEAARRGWISSVGIMGFMEVGDAFSHFGFSYEDFIMNMAGATTGYWLTKHPYWNQRLSLRLEYLPRFTGDSSFPTDYEHSKYFLALRSDTILGEQQLWRYVDLQAGYYARGYELGGTRRRHWFIGIGLDLSSVAQWLGWQRTSRVLHYWQPANPGIRAQYEPDE